MKAQSKIFLLMFIILFINNFSFAQSGKLLEQSLMHDGSLRTYSIYVPPDYDGETHWPLVINFHGYTSNVSDQVTRTKMNVIADTADFLVAYPQGLEIQRSPDILPGFIPSSGTGWSVPGFSTEYNDIDFTEKVIDQIISDYSVDISRIHTTGLSLGGYMAFYVASQLPDRIASVAGVAGHLTSHVQKSFGQNKAMSAMFVHGNDDKITFYNGLEGQYPSIPDAASLWAGQNMCSGDSIVTDLPDLSASDNTTVSLIHYSGCDDKTEVLLYRVNNGGHRWPGSGYTDVPTLLGNNSLDFDTSSEVLNFFKRNANPDSPAGLAVRSDKFSNLQFELKQNYPNPFNPVTLISWQSAVGSHVELSIYNTTGQLITTLVNESFTAGFHQTSWDATGVAAGIYFYQLKVDHFQDVKKMIVVK